ncbi:hypothetical protein H0O02_04210 [Candidatus Micrarchaeota archaeon]|nr:hypothetical protein [Candidatus Micrarchaeota archaeon]
MMRPHLNAVIVVLFLLSGIVFPFTASNYFYATESNVTITSEDFTFGGSDYSIIYFDGTPTFLLKEDQLVEDGTEISTVVHDYYAQRYYPSQEEITEVKNLVAKYNASRNNGYDWKNMEEYKCREVLFTDKKIEMYIDGQNQKLWCHDDASCELNAKLLYQAYNDALGLGSYEPILIPLKKFAYASYGTDAIIANMTNMLDNMNEDSVVGTVDYIQTSIPTLTTYASDIETVVFRTPRLNDSVDRSACHLKCYAICPSFDLDQSALTELDTAAGTLSENIEPLASYAQTSVSIHDNTIARLGNYQNLTTATSYDARFSPIERNGLAAESYARNVSALVSNTSFSLSVDRLSELHTSIKSSISSRNFEGLDEDIAEYERLTATVRNSADSLYGIYNGSLTAKNTAETVLFEVGTKDLGPAESERFDEIKAELAQLDAEFGDGLTPARYAEMEESYTQITDDATALLKSTESGGMSQAIVYFRGFARQVNGGIAGFAESTNITSVQEIPENKYLVLGGFSLLVFLSFSAILMMLFLYFIKAHNYSKIKYIVISCFALALILVAFFSVMLYFFMQKTSTDATMDEFLVDFQQRENVAVVVNAALATESEKSAMESCAAGIAASIAGENRTIASYYFEGGGNCRKIVGSGQSTMTEDACLSEINGMGSAIYLNPSGTIDEPRLYTTYFSKAEIYATSDYYSTCPLSAIFG